MEGNEHHHQRRMYLPDLKFGKPLRSATKHSERGKSERKGKEETKKTVTMAFSSKYLTDRHYVMRKPLFTAEQHVSVLKVTHPQKLTDKEKQLCVTSREFTGMKYLTGQREALIPERYSLSHHNVSPRPATSEDPSPALSVPWHQAELCCEEPTLGSPFSRSSKQILSSSLLEVQKLHPPLRPPLTSTVLHPTYTPRSGQSKQDQTKIRLWDEEKSSGGEAKLSSTEVSKVHSLSSNQASYWACAIPKGLPPSSDRISADWSPNKEYQALLDYTYPLRAGHMESQWDTSELKGDSLLQTDTNLQDSGIELDHLFSTTSLSRLDFSVSEVEQTREGSPHSASYGSADPQGLNRCSDRPLSSTSVFFTDHMNCSRNRGGKNDGCHHQHHARPLSTLKSSTYSSSVLPQFRCDCVEIDDDFWPLPEQLEELQQLSKQVREVTAKLSGPVTASCESVDQGSSSNLPPTNFPEKQREEEKEEAGDHRHSETSTSCFGPIVEPDGGLVQSGPREGEASEEQLCGPVGYLPDTKNSSLNDQSYTLMHHIQVFCSHLELLTQQLRAVSQRMERLAAPTVDVDSVRSSLTEYQCFQTEVNSHHLTSSVLHAGQHLLSCINTSSPLLRDTLLLIERESGALQTYTDHFFSSILSAMHRLTEPTSPSPVRQRREEDHTGTSGFSLGRNCK